MRFILNNHIIEDYNNTPKREKRKMARRICLIMNNDLNLYEIFIKICKNEIGKYPIVLHI